MNRAYHNDQENKLEAILNAERHCDDDLLITDQYTMNAYDAFGKPLVKGCSVGCDAYDITGQILTHSDRVHEITAEHFGFPVWIEYMRDHIFEQLSRAHRIDWHVNIKRAIPCGFTEAQFEQVRLKFLRLVMIDNQVTLGLMKLNDAEYLARTRSTFDCVIVFIENSLTKDGASAARRAVLLNVLNELGRHALRYPAIGSSGAHGVLIKIIKSAIMSLSLAQLPSTGDYVADAMESSGRYTAIFPPARFPDVDFAGVTHHYATELISLLKEK